MKKFLLAVVLVVMLAGVLPQQVRAAEDSGNTIICQKGYVCKVLSDENLKKLRDHSYNWGEYLQQGDWTYEALTEYVVVENPFQWTLYGAYEEVPTLVVVDRNSFTAIDQMGLDWQMDRLIFHKPGSISTPEVKTGVPSNQKQSMMMVGEIQEPKWDGNDEFMTSYYFDGRQIMKWRFIVDVNEAQVVFHIISATFTFLNPVASLPADESTNYDEVGEFRWTSGEALYVNEAYLGVSYALETHDTWWRGYSSWVDGYSFQREDGLIVKINARNLRASRGCFPESCYSTGFFPKTGQTVYVDPHTFSILDQNKSDNDLLVYDVYPGVQLKPEHQALLDQRITAGQVDVVEGIVSNVYVEMDGTKKLIGLGGYDYVDLPISYMPPMGTEIIAYIYNDSGLSVTPRNNGVWSTMALFDKKTGLCWWLNLNAEDLGNFSPEVYTVR